MIVKYYGMELEIDKIGILIFVLVGLVNIVLYAQEPHSHAVAPLMLTTGFLSLIGLMIYTLLYEPRFMRNDDSNGFCCAGFVILVPILLALGFYGLNQDAPDLPYWNDCYELVNFYEEQNPNARVFIDDCVEYMNENPEATGQDVINNVFNPSTKLLDQQLEK